MALANADNAISANLSLTDCRNQADSAHAKANAEANGITNCDFFAGDMKDVLNEAFIAAHGRPDVIILDPPRAGIHPDVAQVILNAAPQRMVYVSCNPASQARDLAILCRDYEITAVQPVDMFPTPCT